MLAISYVMQYDTGDTNWFSVILSLALCIVWGAVCSNIMKKKGRSSGAGWALGIFLGLIGVLICALLSNKAQVQQLGPQMKFDEMRCPHCQNVIKIGAAVCQYCGKDPRIPPSA